MYHIPVLLKESVDGLAIQPDGIYVDVTFGGGGHSKEILNRLGASGKLYAFDRDADARANDTGDSRLCIIPSDFKFIERELTARNVPQVNGILADLGVSSHQFDTPQRGFSFRFDAPLDMRMDTAAPLTAAEILQTYTAADLQTMFSRYGEVPNAKTLANVIVNQRLIEPITSTFQFEKIIEKPCIPHKERNKYLAQVYQALRIEVNGELDALQALLLASLRLLQPNGRISVISYHSLEDRWVKHFLKAGNFEGEVEKDFFGNVQTPWKSITRKAIQPDLTEINLNPRARSAKLRIAEKI